MTTLQESTRKLIDTQTEVAKATAEAAKYLSEARSLGRATTSKVPKSSTNRLSNEAGENDDSESIG